MFKYLNKTRVRTGLGIISLLFAPTSLIEAEIATPYVVDLKPQVLFGDSTTVTSASTTYQGLENYTHEYVGSYLHLTFTYTHAAIDTSCCVASYPPKLYVTDTDPQSTTTPAVKSLQDIYLLLPKPIPPGHETDWYLYDIQFDSTGYTVSVLQGGATSTANFHTEIADLTEADWVALANLYPNTGSVFSFAFEPLPIKEIVIPPSPPVATTTPVIIVPGIMGTELLEDNPGSRLIWPNFPEIALSITDGFLDALKMDNDGAPLNQHIVPGELLTGVGNVHYWDVLTDLLKESRDLFTFPYDWRLDVLKTASDIEDPRVLSLKEKIDEIKAQKGVEKVDLIAHSMGGLVVKKYLKDYGGDSVGKFIDIGTPHTGAPSAFKILTYGDNIGVRYIFGIFNLNSNKIKEISQNMPAVYELLPSESYVDSSDLNYSYYVFKDNRQSFEETQNYLKTEGRNTFLVDRAQAFHEEIDGLNPADYGVTTYNIVGCGTPTIGQFYILDDSTDHPIYNIRMISGDGTVPLKSAQAMTASSTYYVRNATHALMPSMSGVKELVAGLLTSISTEDLNISAYLNISEDQSGCGMPNGKIVSFHSPIDLHIYDQSGNHSGPNADGDIENNIPGVSYETIGDNKFAFLPEGTEYTIKGNATGAGSFDVRIEELVEGEVATTTVFANIPLTLTTQAQFTIGSSTPGQIALDNENDGSFESSFDPSTITSGFLESAGKPVLVPPVSSGSGGGSHSKPALVVEEKIEAPLMVEREKVAQEKRPLTLSVIDKSPELIKPLPGESTSTEVSREVKYKNTAVVYKSLGYKITTFFKKLWHWFISRL
jgi:pimeloyl-ACP methyl ester carboxylesterase